jgi:replicative DNA helicase
MKNTTMKETPHNLIAEKSTISAIMASPNLMTRCKGEGIGPHHFHLVECRTLWSAIEAHLTALPDFDEIDLHWILDHVNQKGDLGTIGGPAMISEIFTYAPFPQNIGRHIESLREYYARRLAITYAAELGAADDSEQAIAAVETALEKLRASVTGANRAKPSKAAVRDFLAKFQSDHASGDIPGTSTGIDCLDAASGGMRAGELWVVGGRPSMGKSVLMLQIAASVALKEKTVAVFSLEMMSHEIIGRMVSATAGCDFGTITQPRKATRATLAAISSGAEKLGGMRFWIEDTAGQTIDTIRAEAEAIRDREGGIALVAVDYLQLIRGNRGRGESREEEVARVSGGLKQLAKRLGCPVLTATQLNEEGKSRESRAIEQDADCLLWISDKNEGVEVRKARNAQRGHVLPLVLQGWRQRFIEEA